MRDKQFVKILINGHSETIAELFHAVQVLNTVNSDFRKTINVLDRAIHEHKQKHFQLTEELKLIEQYGGNQP